MPTPVQLSPDELAQFNQQSAPAAQPVQLSPEELDQFNQQAQPIAPAKPIQPFQDLSPQELAEFSHKTQGDFSILNSYNQLPPEQQTPQVLQKASDAYDLVKHQPFSLPGVGKMLSNLWDLAKSGAQQVANYARPVVEGAQNGVVSPETLLQSSRGIAEGWAGSEAAVGALGNQIKNAVSQPAGAFPFAAPLTADSDTRRESFVNALAAQQTQQESLAGKGAFMQAVGKYTLADLEKAGFPVRPEQASELAQSDPFSLWMFGKAFDAMSPAAKAMVPEAVQSTIEKYSDIAAGVIRKGAGNTAKIAGGVAGAVGKGIEKSAPYVGRPIAAAVGASESGLHGALTGLAFGKGTIETLKEIGKKTAEAAKGVQQFGEGVAGPAATGTVSQFARDLIEAAPGTAIQVGKGAALDIGLQAATAETPEQQQSFTPFGTAFGLLHGAEGAGVRVIGGQVAGPREFGEKAGYPNSGSFADLNKLHNAAMATAPAKVQEQIRAIQQFKQGVAPGTDVFYIPPSENDSLPQVLQDLGASQARAFDIAGSDGVTTTLKDAKGVEKPVVIFSQVAAAPHEVAHAMDIALGSQKVDELNYEAKQQYGDLWDKFSDHYARRLSGGTIPPGETASDVILDKSGFGAEGVKKKLGPQATPEQLADWKNILNPAEQQSQLDRYIGAEVRAENSDAYFKRTGGKGPDTSLSGKMFNAAAQLASVFTDPLQGRSSEGLGLPLRFGAFNSAADAIEATKNALPKSARAVVHPKPPGALIPKTPEEIAQNAEDARQVAANSPTIAAPGESPTTANAPQTPREALGVAAEAIAGQTPIKYNYRGAPGTTGGVSDVNMEQRRQEIESARNIPENERQLADVRTGFPYKVEMTGKGPQILDWSPAALTANALRWAKSITELAKREPGAAELAQVPYEMDFQKGEFTAAGWKSLLADAAKFSANHLAGFTGAGDELIVPAGLESAGVHQPLRITKTAPFDLPQEKSDFLNMLYGERPPETPRVSRKSGVPLNIVAQKVSEATQPGRIVEPALIHAKKKQAATLGVQPGTLVERAPFAPPIQGVEKIQEVNPTRGALETALQRNGIELPGMSQVTRRLNLEHVHSIEPAPKVERTVGWNPLTGVAGFMPSKEPRAIAMAAVKDKDTGKIYTGSWHGEATMNYLESTAAEGDDLEAYQANPYPLPNLVDGFTTNKGEFLDREEALKRAVEMKQYVKENKQDTTLETDSFHKQQVARASAAKRGEPYTTQFMHSLEGIKRMNDEEVARQQRNSDETETTRASSYAGTPESGIVLHSAKQRSTMFVKPGASSKEFEKAWKAAGDNQEIKNHLVESYFTEGSAAGAAQFKPRDEELELRHWSNIPGLKVLNPAFHGTGLSGEERARQRDYKKIYVPRTYFGTKDYTKEPSLGPEQYRAFVKKRSLYPFQEDPKDLFPSQQEVENAGYAPMDSKAANTLYENKIAKAGYEGYIHRDAKVAAKFTNTPVEHIGTEGEAQFKPPALKDFQDEKSLSAALKKPGWAIITATQEAKGEATHPDNIAANEDLAAHLKEQGYTFSPVSGAYNGIDQGKSFLVTGISPQEALSLGKKYGQESVLTPQGYVYQDGSIAPAVHENTVTGPEAEKQSGWSKVEGGPAFSMGIDFDNKTPAAKTVVTRPEQQMMSSDFYPAKEQLSTKQVGEMSPAELKEHYPEAVVVPDKENGDGTPLSSDITHSPLFKEAGTPEKAVDVFAKRLADFARQYKDNPAYQDGLRWYSEFVPILKEEYGKHAKIMAELLAATSPQNNPTQNFAMANDALEMFKKGKFDKLITKYEEGLSKLADGTWKKSDSKTPAGFLADWVDKHDLKPKQSNGKLYNMHSVPVLQVLARRWLENTQGPKTQNFVKNLLGTGHGATYDVWADRTLRRLGYSGHEARWRILPKNAVGVSDADFQFGQKVFSKAAKDLGVRPDSLQGALWFAEKQLWADNGWGRLDLGDFRTEIKRRQMLNQGIEQRLATREAAEATPKQSQAGFDFIQPRNIR